MPNSLRYALPVILGLALFSGLSYLLVSATSRGWFEEDVRLRAELALRGARVGVTEGWARGDRAGVERLLTDITKDERVLAAAACAPDSTAFAQTSDFPEGLGCRRFAAVSMADGKPRAWSGVDKSGGTGVFLSALPIYTAAGVPLGVVGIIQDMSYIEHRDRVTRRAAIWFFGLMSLGALLLSTGVARASWGRFRSELRAIVKGGEDRPEFQPLLRDVRELARSSPPRRAPGRAAAPGPRSGCARCSTSTCAARSWSSSPTASPTSTTATPTARCACSTPPAAWSPRSSR